MVRIVKPRMLSEGKRLEETYEETMAVLPYREYRQLIISLLRWEAYGTSWENLARDWEENNAAE